VSTSTALDAERVPDAFGVHRVTTFRQASQVAAARAYGFSVFTRRAPGLARAVSPWLWPLHMMGAGRQGSGIIVTMGASLSLTGERAQRPVWSAFVVGPVFYVLEIGLIITPVVFGLCLAGAPGGYPDIGFAVGWSLAIGWPLLLEMTAMTVALAFNPERFGLTRRRKALVKAGRHALTVDFLVRSPGAAKGAGQRLMTSLQADWRRQNAIVVGYPANRGLIRFYVELGARRDYPRGRGNGKRRMAIDAAPPTEKAIAR